MYRHSIRLDRLIDLVLERLRYYVQNYYTLKEMELPQPRNTKRDVLLQEQKALTAQLEKRSAALKNLYLDKSPAFERGAVCGLESGLPRGKKPPGTTAGTD